MFLAIEHELDKQRIKHVKYSKLFNANNFFRNNMETVDRIYTRNHTRDKQIIPNSGETMLVALDFDIMAISS